MADPIRKTKVILWGAWYGSKNVGDQALLLSITDMLGQSLSDVEFIVVTNNPGYIREYTKRDSVYNFQPVHSRKQFIGLVRFFISADLFILGGGVPFYDDWFHSLTIFILTALSRLFGVPCILWSVSSQRIRSNFTRFALRYLLSNTRVITYRDWHTRQLLLECGMDDAQGRLVPDPVFTMSMSDNKRTREILERNGWHFEGSRPMVALTPRPLRGDDGEAHTHYASKSLDESNKEIRVFAAVLDWLWENGYQPVFVPMNTVAPDDDRMASLKVMEIAKYGKNALLIDEIVFPREAANVYAYCQAAFVARVHGSVMAFLGRTPVMMYAFDLKHGGIMEQMGFAREVFDPDGHSETDAVEMMNKLLQNRPQIQAEMEEKAGELKKQARIPLDAILRLLDG